MFADFFFFFSVIAAENPHMCDLLLQLFVCLIPGVGELGPQGRRSLASQPQEGWRRDMPCAWVNRASVLGGWRDDNQSICIFFASKIQSWETSWFYMLLAQLDFILISVKKLKARLSSTRLRFHCEHFLQLFRVFCCSKGQLIVLSIIYFFKEYIHMAIIP